MSLDAIGIVSHNLKESVKFYGILGVELKEVGGSSDHLEGITPSGVRLMIDAVELIKKLNPDWQDPIGCGVILCFKQTTSLDVDTLYSAITQAGFLGKKKPWDAFWGQRYASVQDPDGNQIDLFANL